MTRIGIFGGTFDPIHKGHLALIRAARRELGLKKIFVVPSFITPLKSRSTASARHRSNMIRMATKPLSYVSLSLFEIKKKRVSYTVQTLRYFVKRFGKEREVYFLGGSDIVKNFSRWKSPDEVLRLARFAVTQRPGARTRLPEGFVGFSMKPFPVSSTGLREGRGKNGFLPPKVLEYISAHGLYGILKRKSWR